MTDPVTLESAVKELNARLKLHKPSDEALSSADAQRSSESAARAPDTTLCALKPTADMTKPLAERLFDLFGGGDNPSLRRSLYLRIQLTCLKFGKPAEEVLAATVDYALHARRPGNCFAYTILRRFREAGLAQEV